MLEKLGYLLLGLAVVAWAIVAVFGAIEAMPYSREDFAVLGGMLLLVGGLLVLFAKVLRERLVNKEDDYYDRNVHL